jgi:hypothetical protein
MKQENETEDSKNKSYEHSFLVNENLFLLPHPNGHLNICVGYKPKNDKEQ